MAEAQRRVEGLSPTDLSAALDGQSLLVDVREPAERQNQGVIAGSLSVPRGTIEFVADPMSEHHRSEFEPGRRVILYCDDGARSSLAAETLMEMGYWLVAYLRGGIDAWAREGRQIVNAQDSAAS